MIKVNELLDPRDGVGTLTTCQGSRVGNFWPGLFISREFGCTRGEYGTVPNTIRSLPATLQAESYSNLRNDGREAMRDAER